jgi:ABC-2 type transport system ATP-binding protein
MENIILVNNLSKNFGSNKAINDLSFSVERGEVFGLLGPNGAGKTTTIRVLNGLLPVSGGEVRIFGEDPIIAGVGVRMRVGVLTETPALYERLSAVDNLKFSGRLAGVTDEELDKRIDEVLGFFDLSARKKDKVGGYSKGMKQRMALARTLLHNPELLYFDEPTSGLDPESAQQVNELIERISHEDGRTVFLCTHNLVEAQRLCDRVAVIDNGSLLAIGTPDQLAKSLFPGIWVEIEFLNNIPAGIETILGKNHGVLQFRTEGPLLHVQVSDKEAISVLITRLAANKAQLTRVTPREITLEEIYFTLQKHQAGKK